MRYHSHHHVHGETIHVLINGVLKLKLKHYKMQTISINVDDNQAEGHSKESAGAILASASRKASKKAKKRNPRLKKVK